MSLFCRVALPQPRLSAYIEIYSRASGVVMQSRNPIFADFADLMSDAFSAAQAAGEEAQSVFRAQTERVAAQMDLVTRDEFDAVKAQIEAQREIVDELKAELEALKKAPAKKATTRKSAPKATDK